MDLAQRIRRTYSFIACHVPGPILSFLDEISLDSWEPPSVVSTTFSPFFQVRIEAQRDSKNLLRKAGVWMQAPEGGAQ